MTWELKMLTELDTNRFLRVDFLSQADGYVQNSLHLMFVNNEEVLAYCRLHPPGEKYDACSIRRVIVKMKARYTGIAKQLMKNAMKEPEKACAAKVIKICVQSNFQKIVYIRLDFIKLY